jgi:WD40 repeat protein
LFAVGQKEKPRNIKVSEFGELWNFNLTPDSKRLVIQNQDSFVCVYDMTTGKRLDTAEKLEVWKTLHWLDENRFASWTPEGTVRVWDSTNGKQVHELKLGQLSAKLRGIAWVRFSRDGKYVAAWETASCGYQSDGYNNYRFRVHQVASGKRIIETTEEQKVFWADFHPDSQTVSVTVNDEFQTFDLGTGKLLQHEKKFGYRAFAFSGDGRSMITFSGSEGRLSVNWNEVATGQQRWGKRVPESSKFDSALNGIDQIMGTDDELGNAVFLCNLGAHNNTLIVRDLATGNEVRTLADRKQGRCALSRNARWLLTRSVQNDSQTLSLYDLREQANDPAGRTFLDAPARMDLSICELAVSNDGKRAVTMSRDRTITVWNLDQLRKLAPPPKPEEKVDLWAILGEENHFGAIWRLHADPKGTLKLFAVKLPAVAKPDARQVEKWIGELGAGEFKVRDAAEKELAAVGESVMGSLQAAIHKPANAEAGERLERLIAKLTPSKVAPEYLRMLRAVEITERLRTPEAVKLLEQWAAGASGASLTVEAAQSLKRIQKQK